MHNNIHIMNTNTYPILIYRIEYRVTNVHAFFVKDMVWQCSTLMAELFRVTVCDYHECKNVLNMVICGTEVPRFER